MIFPNKTLKTDSCHVWFWFKDETDVRIHHVPAKFSYPHQFWRIVSKKVYFWAHFFEFKFCFTDFFPYIFIDPVNGYKRIKIKDNGRKEIFRCSRADGLHSYVRKLCLQNGQQTINPTYKVGNKNPVREKSDRQLGDKRRHDGWEPSITSKSLNLNSYGNI